MRYPGLPGGGPFNWDSLPVLPDGPRPKSGILAQDKIIPPGVKHYLATPEFPRKQSDRIPPDEFALMVASYNDHFGTNLPIDPMARFWRRNGDWWNTREAIARVATGRWNSFMCRAGRGHCPHPGPFKWLAHAVSSAVHVLSKVGKFVLPIAKMVPFLGQGIAAVEAVQNIAKIGSDVVSASKVLTAGKALLPFSDHGGFDLGAALMSAPNITPEKLAHTRALLTGAQKRGFDTAVAMQTGRATKSPPADLSDAAKAAFYAQHGMQKAPLGHKTGMLKTLVVHPEALKGITHANTQFLAWTEE